MAPCGNDSWQQCRDACTKDIWEPGEVPDGVCPHCGAPLIPNTVAAEHYIEEGYLPQWQAYTRWLAGTLNKELLILELGVGFGTPTVIRWPFVSRPAAAAAKQYQPGDIVEHKVFGRGTVLRVKPAAGDQIVEIQFDKVGVKKTMANFAPLTKLTTEE